MRAGTPGTYDGLADEFVMSIIEARKPLVNIAWALNMGAEAIRAYVGADFFCAIPNAESRRSQRNAEGTTTHSHSA